MKDWDSCLLGEVATIQTGPFGTQLHSSDYIDNGTPVIMPTNIGANLNIVTTDIARISDNKLEHLIRYQVYKDDIIYSRRGDIEKCAFITKKQHGWLCGTGCLRVRFFDINCCPKYYAYQLSADDVKGWVSGHAVGSTMPNLNSSILSRIPLVKPPLNEQRAIAAVLSSLDDKIDLLNRQNVTLEAMAEALFVELFIKNNNKKDNIDYISKYIKFNPSYSIQKGTLSQFLEMSNINTNSFHPSDIYPKKFSSGMKFMNGDTLLARITPCLENGKACYVTFLEKDEIGWGSTEYIVMHPIECLHPFFAYCLAKSDDFRDFAENCLQGSSGRQRIDMHHLQQYQINSPTKEKIKKFNDIAISIEPKLHNNFIQTRTLEKLRDTLLPKLMSGEVRVAIN